MASRSFRGADARIKFSADTKEFAAAGSAFRKLASIFESTLRDMQRATEAVDKAQQRLAKSQERLVSARTSAANSASRVESASIRSQETQTRLAERQASLIRSLGLAQSQQALQAQNAAIRAANLARKITSAKSEVARTPEKEKERDSKLSTLSLRALTREVAERQRIQTLSDAAIRAEERIKEAVERRSEVLSRLRGSQESLYSQGISLATRHRNAVQDLATLEKTIAADRQSRASRVASETRGVISQFNELRKAGEEMQAFSGSKVTGKDLFTSKGLAKFITTLEAAKKEVKSFGDLSLDQAQQVAAYDAMIQKVKSLIDSRKKLRESTKDADESRLRGQQRVNDLADRIQRNEAKASDLKGKYTTQEVAQARNISRLREASLEATNRKNTAERLSAQILSQNAEALKRGQAAVNESFDQYKSRGMERLRALREQRKAEAEGDTQSAKVSANRVKELQTQVNAAKRQLSQQKKNVDAVKTSGESLKVAEALKVAAAVKAVTVAEKALSEAQEGVAVSASKSSKAFTALAASLPLVMGAAGPAAIVALTAALAGLAIGGLNALVRMERLRATFDGLIGDVRASKALMDDLVSTSTKQASPLSGRLEGARILLTVQEDIGRVGEDLKRLETLAVVANQPLSELSVIYSEILTKQRVYREDILQFSRRGIPVIRELEKNLGRSRSEINQMVSEGRVGFEDFSKALETMTADTASWGRAMAEVNDTISGTFTQSLNSWSVALIKIGDLLDRVGAGVALKGAVGLLKAAGDSVASLSEKLEYALSLLDVSGGKLGAEERITEFARASKEAFKSIKGDPDEVQKRWEILSKALNKLNSDLQDIEYGAFTFYSDRETAKSAIKQMNDALKAVGLPEITIPVGMEPRDFIESKEFKDSVKSLQTLKEKLEETQLKVKDTTKTWREFLSETIKGDILKELGKIEVTGLSDLDILSAKLNALTDHYKTLREEAKKAFDESFQTPKDLEALKNRNNEIDEREKFSKDETIRDSQGFVGTQEIERLKELLPLLKQVSQEGKDLGFEQGMSTETLETLAKIYRIHAEGLITEAEKFKRIQQELERSKAQKETESTKEALSGGNQDSEEIDLLKRTNEYLAQGVSLSKALSQAKLDSLLDSANLGDEERERLKNLKEELRLQQANQEALKSGVEGEENIAVLQKTNEYLAQGLSLEEAQAKAKQDTQLATTNLSAEEQARLRAIQEQVKQEKANQDALKSGVETEKDSELLQKTNEYLAQGVSLEEAQAKAKQEILLAATNLNAAEQDRLRAIQERAKLDKANQEALKTGPEAMEELVLIQKTNDYLRQGIELEEAMARAKFETLLAATDLPPAQKELLRALQESLRGGTASQEALKTGPEAAAELELLKKTNAYLEQGIELEKALAKAKLDALLAGANLPNQDEQRLRDAQDKVDQAKAGQDALKLIPQAEAELDILKRTNDYLRVGLDLERAIALAKEDALLAASGLTPQQQQAVRDAQSRTADETKVQGVLKVGTDAEEELDILKRTNEYLKQGVQLEEALAKAKFDAQVAGGPPIPPADLAAIAAAQKAVKTEGANQEALKTGIANEEDIAMQTRINDLLQKGVNLEEARAKAKMDSLLADSSLDPLEKARLKRLQQQSEKGKKTETALSHGVDVEAENKALGETIRLMQTGLTLEEALKEVKLQALLAAASLPQAERERITKLEEENTALEDQKKRLEQIKTLTEKIKPETSKNNAERLKALVEAHKAGTIDRATLEKESQKLFEEVSPYKKIEDSFGMGSGAGSVFDRFQGQATRTIEDLLKEQVKVTAETQVLINNLVTAATTLNLSSLQAVLTNSLKQAGISQGIVN